MDTCLLRVRDCAKMLAISQRTVWRLLERNELTAIRVGKSVRVEREQLETFISNQRKVGADVA